MKVCEIYINRRGINTIEIPRQVEVVAGETLVLKFINLGHPTHVSISATNSQLYTPFIQQNLYVSDVAEYEIPIKVGPYAGVFEMEVVTGYGTKRASFKVFVAAKCEPPPQAPVKTEAPRRLAFSFDLPTIFIATGIVLYIIWLLFRLDSVVEVVILPVDAFNPIGFIMVLAGALLAWCSRRSL